MPEWRDMFGMELTAGYWAAIPGRGGEKDTQPLIAGWYQIESLHQDEEGDWIIRFAGKHHQWLMSWATLPASDQQQRPRYERELTKRIPAEEFLTWAHLATVWGELIMSELAANAVKQVGRVDGPPTARPTGRVAVVIVGLRLVAGAVRLDVWDNDRTVPKLGQPSLYAEAGQGLLLVSTLAARWRSYPVRQPGRGRDGKIVWAEVAR